jgi:hypothetical protein
MKRFLVVAALILGLYAAPAAGQTPLEQTCDRAEVQALGATDACVATVQAVVSAQPTLGILLAGGNPTLGGAGAGGFRLGIIPRVSAGVRMNVVPMRLPDILAEQIPGQVGNLTQRFGAPVPAFSGDVSISLLPGMSIAPGLGGIGAVSLLGSATYMPLHLLASRGFDRSDLGYGLGARLHLISESFIAPVVSVSLMRKRMSEVAFGDVCPQGTLLVTLPGSTPQQQVSACPGPGDAGEFAVDLVDWSGRLVAGKSLFGIGAAVGIGHDRYGSDISLGFRGRDVVPGTGAAPVFIVPDARLTSTRWTGFGNLAFSFLVAAAVVEAGWQQGTPPITGFRNIGSDFDPRGGAWYGSVGARLSL